MLAINVHGKTGSPRSIRKSLAQIRVRGKLIWKSVLYHFEITIKPRVRVSPDFQPRPSMPQLLQGSKRGLRYRLASLSRPVNGLPAAIQAGVFCRSLGSGFNGRHHHEPGFGIRIQSRFSPGAVVRCKSRNCALLLVAGLFPGVGVQTKENGAASQD